MADEFDEATAAAQLGVTVDELHALGRKGAFGGWWKQGMALSPQLVAAARDQLTRPSPAERGRIRPISRPTPPWSSAAAAAGRPPTPTRTAPPPPPPTTPSPPASPMPASSTVPDRTDRRGGRHGGGGANVRTGREVEIPARAWVASVQRTATQWAELQAKVAVRRRAGDDGEFIRAQLLRAGVPADVVDQLQPR